MKTDILIRNVHLATCVPAADDDYGIVTDGALAIADERIAWVGRAAQLPRHLRADEEIDGAQGWITPGLIDCHTHLVYAGNRYAEFEARLQGTTYAEIAARGGGIRATVAATRAADDAALYAASRPRLHALMDEGVTTVEIKSGYGLDARTERAQLAVARAFSEREPIDTRATFLGAHALPAEFAGRADDYVGWLAEVLLPQLADDELVDAVDAFCETIGFSPAQVERLFVAAQALGLPVKLHAEQLSDQGGAQLVARFGGLSADHLEHLSLDGVAAMARAGTVGVLLPGAFYMLRETRLPPIDALRAANVPLAVATDLNPGTSPVASILTTLNMACTLFRLTPAEALAGATRCAAQALGLAADRGTLETGKRADLVLWGIEHPRDLVCQIGINPIVHRFFAGRRSFGGARTDTDVQRP